jgi:hypothetical protein
MKTIIIPILLILVVACFAAPDPCSPIPTCIECVKHQFCGWCSTPVVFIDGSRGKRCAYQGENAKPFVCDGSYQTETCIPEAYKCDNTSFQCRPVAYGTGEEIESCLAKCFPTTYYCDKAKKQCIQTQLNGTSFEECNRTCIHGEKQYTCDTEKFECVPNEKGSSMESCMSTCGKAHNITPDALPGKWRGIQINVGYKSGEWKMTIGKDSTISIARPDKSVYAQGVLQQMENELWIQETDGVRRSIFVNNQQPTVKILTWAVGNKGSPPPPDFDTAMKKGTPGDVFIFWKCVSESNCDFSQVQDVINNMLRKVAPAQEIDDACSIHPDCQSCIDDPANKCGWCSTNVIYKNGTIIGKQCAGHNNDGTKDPFICNGMYSTETCIPFGTTSTTDTSGSTGSTGSTGTTSTSTSSSTTSGKMDKFECNSRNITCDPSNNGPYDYKVDCEQVCRSTPIPIDLIGTWRGLQVNKNYIQGEWKAVFTADSVTITKPDGDKLTGKVTLVGEALVVDPTSGPLKGKKISGLWNLAFGPASRFLLWAWGVPGGAAPKSFESAMTEANNAEFAMASCLPGKDKAICNFDV